MCRDPELGVGLALHFQFVWSLCVCFFVMSVLSIPSLYCNYFGNRMPAAYNDGMGFYQFTLGNLGYNRDSPTFIQDSRCSAELSYFAKNETCIHVPLFDEIPLSLWGSILSACEIVQIAVFFLTIWHLQRRTDSLYEETRSLLTSVTGFSVMITNLPKDFSRNELIDHLSNLYPLDRDDWAKRPPVQGARPINNVGLIFSLFFLSINRKMLFSVEILWMCPT